MGDRVQFDQLKRREVITLLGAALTWPLAASGQQSDQVRRIGVLSTGFEANPVTQIHIQAFRQSLQKLGWTQGHNVQIDYRFAAGDPDRMRLNASEMVGLAPDVIVGGNTQTVEALQRATRTVPIVFVSVSDPVGRSFVGSLAHPGGNITGFTNEVEPLGGKWLQVLKEIAPRVTRVALMFNPDTALSYYLHQFEALAPSFAVKPITGAVHNAAEAVVVLQDEMGSELVGDREHAGVMHGVDPQRNGPGLRGRILDRHNLHQVLEVGIGLRRRITSGSKWKSIRLIAARSLSSAEIPSTSALRCSNR